MKRPQVMTPAQSKSETTAEIFATAGVRDLAVPHLHRLEWPTVKYVSVRPGGGKKHQL
ncbi:MAG TPA: hypothetical protein VNO50_10590 [Pyrinomonadaceae bacterium]|nr:hypothetical protein [Pyrinomonadaceae bacterium]